MNINITSSRYGFEFSIVDGDKTIFSSKKHHKITSFVQSSYEHSWEGCRDARRLVADHPYHILRRAGEDGAPSYATEVSAESMIVDHYKFLLESLEERIVAAQKLNDEEGVKDIHAELTIIFTELETVYENFKGEQKGDEDVGRVMKDLRGVHEIYVRLFKKYFNGKKADIDLNAIRQNLNPKKDEGLGGMASANRVIKQSVNNEDLEEDLQRELFEEYAKKACESIQDFHNCFYSINLPKKIITISDLEEGAVLKIAVNDKMNVDGVYPVGKLGKEFPSYSGRFYQKYWKPIVESIGHFYIDDNDVIILGNLPDLPKDEQSYTLEGWNAEGREKQLVDVSFRGKDPIWIFEQSSGSNITKAASSRYTEQDYTNAVVKCIDPKQQTVYGKIGEIIQVIPHEDMVEVDVKFFNLEDEKDSKIARDKDGIRAENELAEGNQIRRMDESQIEIIEDAELERMNLTS